MAWYASQGVPDVALRVRDAAFSAIDDLADMPDAGPPRPSPNPRLTGLRRWPVKGFPEVRAYYLAKTDSIIIVRVLHDERETERVLTVAPT